MPVLIPFVVAAAAAAADIVAVGGVAAAFATAGSLAGVLTAASLGFAAGSIIGNLLFPTHTTSASTGPRIGDLSVQVSTYGAAIPIVFGTDRLAGNVIWALPTKEVSTTTTQTGGGKGPHGGSSASQTSFTYFGNFAVGLCEGTKAGILRIWANNNLIFDTRTGSDVVKKQGTNFTFYTGTETQLPDPSMEADKGTGNVPAHRGLCYVVFHDLPLADFGNVLPSLSFEIADDLSTSTHITDFTYGPTFTHDDAFVGALNFVGIDYRKNLGYAGWAIFVFSGISTFDLTTLVTNREVLAADILVNTYTQVFPTCYVGTDQNLYLDALNGTDFWLIKVDSSTFKEVDATFVMPYAAGAPSFGFEHSIGTRVFNADNTFFDCLFYVACAPDFFMIAVLDTAPLVVQYTSDRIVGAIYPGLTENAMVVGATGSTHSDFFVTSDLLATSNVTSELRRIRVSDDGVDVVVVRTFVPTELSPTATGMDKLLISGVDFSASLLILSAHVTDVSSGDYLLAVDTGSFNLVWSYKSTSSTTGKGVIDPSYGNVSGNLLTEFGGSGVLTDTATGVGEPVDSPSTSGYDVFWDSLTRSYLRHETRKFVSRVYVGRKTGQTTTLGAICTSLSEKISNSAVDTTTIDDIIVTGFTVSRTDSCANALNGLLAGFQVDVVESDYRVKFKLRGSATVADLTERVLMDQSSPEAPEPYKETWQQAAELPSYLNVTYEDPALDYQPNTQHDQRVRILANPTMFSGQTSDIQLPVVMDATTARQVADQLLYTSWLNRHTFQLRLAPRYLWLDPADPVNFTLRSGYTLRARLGKTDLGGDFTSDTLLISESDGQYTSTLTVTVTNPFPLSIPIASPSLMILLDVPLLRDDDEVTTTSMRGYWGASTYSSGNYQGATLYVSADATAWTQLDAVPVATPFGHTETPPPDPTLMWVVETGTSFNVMMSNGSSHLVSVSDIDLLNGANAAALLKSNGEVEVLQYRDVTALGGDRFTLSNLLRGRRGTDTMASGHTSGEELVLLGAGTIHGLAGSISNRNVPLWWGAVTAGAVPNPNLRQSFTFHGRDKFPYAPVGVTAVLSAGNINLAWVRRTRVDGALRDNTGVVPLHESAEAYEVDIFSGPGGSFKRTLAGLSSPAAIYTSGQISSDFGSAPATLTLRVYQISGLVGRGFSREDTVLVG